MTRNLILFSSLILGAFACSDADKGPGYATPVLGCEVDGMRVCETRLLVMVSPDLPPFIEFGAYDLSGEFESGFGIAFSWENNPTEYTSPQKLAGEVKLNEFSSGKLPIAEFNTNKSNGEIKIWNSQEATIHAVYDEETRTLDIEWDLELEQTQPIVNPPPTLRARGKAISPVYVQCWNPIDGTTSVLDENFETEYCKSWKEFHTPARFPDL